MNKRLLIKFLLVLLPTSFFAQYNLDFGGNIGVVSYLGDIGASNEGKPFLSNLDLSATRFGIGAFARYKVLPYLGVQANLGWYRISGDDKTAIYLPRKLRNLSFKNDIIELAVTTQFYFFEVPGIIQTMRTNLSFSAYGFGGFGLFYHNPQALYNGSYVDLQPLKTEGVDYGSFGFNVPAGIGGYFTYNRKHKIGFELCYRLSFTDYLDDVSDRYVGAANLESPTAVALADRSGELSPESNQEAEILAINYGGKGALRGNKENNDTYFSFSLNYAYSIKGKSSFTRSRYSGLFGKKSKRRRIRTKF